MLANMASSLIIHKRITTTTAKAKALRIFVEPVITRSKKDSIHSRRMVFRHLRDKDAVTELFRDVAAKVGERPGGYTRIIKIGNRLGDNADMCIIELVDYNETLLTEKADTKPKTSRRRRAGGKKKTEQPVGAVETEVIDDGTEVADVTEDVVDVPVAGEIESTEVVETEETIETVPEAKEETEEEKKKEE